MSLVYVGSMPISALCPIVYASIGQVGVSLNAGLQGNLAVNASFTASPPTLATVLSASANFSAAMTAAAASIPPVPNVSFGLSDCATLSASLSAGLPLLASLEALLSAAIGIYSFAYTGTANALGSSVATELVTQWPDATPTSGTCQAMLFGAALIPTASPTNIAETQLASFLNGLTIGSGLVYTGKIGLGSLSPVTLSATAQGTAGINAQIAATNAMQVSLSVTPPSYAAMIASQARYAASLKAIPNVKFALAATAKAAANITAKFGALCQLGATLGRLDATLFVYTYSGVANAMGAAITSSLATTWGDGVTLTSGACTAALLAATDSPTWTAMTSFFGGA